MKAIAAILLTALSISSFEQKHFKRVEKFPQGEQTRTLVGSLLSGINDTNVITYTFDAPYPTAWPVVQQVSREFSKVSGRPLVAIQNSDR
jgi:hypothetical protein